MAQKKFTVKYAICDYSGQTEVYADENADNEEIAYKAEKQLARGCPFPIGYRSFKVIDVEDIE